MSKESNLRASTQRLRELAGSEPMVRIIDYDYAFCGVIKTPIGVLHCVYDEAEIIEQLIEEGEFDEWENAKKYVHQQFEAIAAMYDPEDYNVPLLIRYDV